MTTNEKKWWQKLIPWQAIAAGAIILLAGILIGVILANIWVSTPTTKIVTDTVIKEKLVTSKDSTDIEIPVDKTLPDTTTKKTSTNLLKGSILAYGRPYILSVSFSEPHHRLDWIEARIDTSNGQETTTVSTREAPNIESFHLTALTDKPEAILSYDKPTLPQKRIADFYVDTRVSYNLTGRLKLSLEPTVELFDRLEIRAEASVNTPDSNRNWYNLGIGIGYRFF